MNSASTNKTEDEKQKARYEGARNIWPVFCWIWVALIFGFIVSYAAGLAAGSDTNDNFLKSWAPWILTPVKGNGLDELGYLGFVVLFLGLVFFTVNSYFIKYSVI